MSISPISSAQSSYQPPSTQSDFSQAFGQLVGALNSGNLAGAQQAFASLTKDAPSIAQGVSSQGGNNPLAKLASALQSGDLAGAQQAFASLTQPAKSHRHGHHPSTATDAAGSGLPGSTSSGASASTAGATAGLLNAIA
jgi:hypothetical protein